MKISSRLRAVLAAFTTAILLPSCALPAGDAWRVIKHDGFLTYLAFELGQQKTPPSLSAPARPASLASQPQIGVPWRTTPNRYLDTNPHKPVVEAPKATKPASPALAAAPKPVLRPQPPKPAVRAPAQQKSATPPDTAEALKPASQNKVEPKVATAPPAPAAPTTTAPGPGKAKSPSPAPPSTSPIPSTPVVAKVDELPYGDIIAGRPGFVHSPYAMKNQIVDVTGLRTGQEVKCPFTGKLFRVPPGEQASAKPADEKK